MFQNFWRFANIDPRSFFLIADTSATLTPSESIWPGRYTVGLMIRDKQGMSCPDTQLLDLNVCSCIEEKICVGGSAAIRAKPSSFKFGLSGIMVLFLGVLLLLCEYSSQIKSVAMKKKLLELRRDGGSWKFCLCNLYNSYSSVQYKRPFPKRK